MVAILLGTFLGIDAAGDRVAQIFPNFEFGFRWKIFEPIQAGYFSILCGAALVLIGGLHYVMKDTLVTLRRVFVVFLILASFWLMAASEEFSFVFFRSDLSLGRYFFQDAGLGLLFGAGIFFWHFAGALSTRQHPIIGRAEWTQHRFICINLIARINTQLFLDP
ncbi:MAG TPA: hypothetical protein VIF82_15120 [Burkholderiaceae bacterium]